MRSVEITYRYGMRSEPARPRPATAEEACVRLNEGNRAFAAILDGLVDDQSVSRRVIDVDASDLGLIPGAEVAPPQRPFAAVIGCADARVPIELIFGEGPNDLFVMRIAGNSLGDDVRGSLAYAIDHLGDSLRLVVVLGHSGCGALTAAVDAFLRPATYLPLVTNHSLRGLLDRQLIVVQACSRWLDRGFGATVTERPGYRRTLIELATATNAALTAHTIQQELRVRGVSALRVVHGVYRLDTREVWSAGGGGAGLADPPADEAAFLDYGTALIRSERIRALLDGPA